VVRTFQDNLEIRLPEALGTFPVTIAGHCTDSGRAIINFPGWNGTMDGYEDKYIKLGHHLASNHGLSFVRTMIPTYDPVTADTASGKVKYRWQALVRTAVNHVLIPTYDPLAPDTARGKVKYRWNEVAKAVVRTAVNYVLDNAGEIAGASRDDVQLHLVGTSAGGGAIAAVAHEFPQVKKLLFVAPASSRRLVGEEAEDGMKKFLGDAAFMIGTRDGEGEDGETVKRTLCFDTMLALGRAAEKHGKKPRYWIVPGADHNFAGREIGKTWSLAFLWAFDYDGQAWPDERLAIEPYGDVVAKTVGGL
jgi:pimeloyl-ACP methyl ester carboxylesterase